ncbi:hypothetical protein [Agrobacterium cavarae]
MSRAKHFYNPDEWISILDSRQLTNAEVAQECKVSVETIYNIINGTVASCQTGTKRKLTAGLLSLGVTEAEINQLFITRL